MELNHIEKGKFYLSTEEFDKAEEYYLQVFDVDKNSPEAITGIVICKIALSNFDKNYIKAAGVYLDMLDESKLTREERELFVKNTLDETEGYFKRILEVFRKEANEITKRSSLDQQIYAVKELSDTTSFLDFVNDNSEKFNKGINLSAKIYNITNKKEDTAFKIAKLHNLVLESIKKTPLMTGKTLLSVDELKKLQESHIKWAELSGDHKEKINTNIGSSGCLVLFIILSGIITSLILT